MVANLRQVSLLTTMLKVVTILHQERADIRGSGLTSMMGRFEVRLIANKSRFSQLYVPQKEGQRSTRDMGPFAG